LLFNGDEAIMIYPAGFKNTWADYSTSTLAGCGIDHVA